MIGTVNRCRACSRGIGFATGSLLLVVLVLMSCSQENGSTTFEMNESPAGLQVQPVYQQEVERLMNHERVVEAFRLIEAGDERTVADQILLNEIPAPPFMEERRARRYAEMMREYGLEDVSIDEEGNVLGRRPGAGDGRTVVLSAHLDTVFPEETDVKVEVRGDTLFAPGIVDDARGLTTVLAVLNALESAGITTQSDILFVGTVGEEGLGDLRGVKALFGAESHGIDAFISVDGSDDRQIINQALGSHRYRVTVEGPGGHSWSAFGTANPAHALGRAIHHFDEAASALVRHGPRTSYNVGRISGGTSVNSVPFSNWMEVDMRSVENERLQQLDRLLHEAVERAVDEVNAGRRVGDPLTFEMEMIGDRPSGEIPAENPFIQRALAATRLFGREPVLVRSSTDSNVPISLGIPSMTLGGGGTGGEAHSLDEWWINEEGYKGVQRVLLILLSEAGVAD